MEYIFSDVLTYIDDHIHEKISLGELAELAGYSPFYFSKIFSVTMGMPVTGYIRVRKLQLLEESLQEVSEGYCTKLDITLLQDGRIRIADNGRGIPLSQNSSADKKVLDKILSGHPISNLEYSQMGDFEQLGLQTVNSLCESWQLNVYRDGKCFKQDYVRGIPQHEISSEIMVHESGTEITIKPDTAIFGDTTFSVELVQEWLDSNIMDWPQLCVHLEQQV